MIVTRFLFYHVNFANHILSHDIKCSYKALSWIFLKLFTNTFSNLTNKFNVFIYSMYSKYIFTFFNINIWQI
jgi:hypothetical protein